MDRVFLYLRVQSDVLLRESGVVFRVVRPVSYRPGAGYCWKYRVPMNELPQLLLSRTDVPNTGSGMVLLDRHRAGDWRSRALGKLASGSQKCVSDLQRVCGGWRSRAALISAAHPLPRELIEPFPNTASPSLGGAPETSTDASWVRCRKRATAPLGSGPLCKSGACRDPAAPPDWAARTLKTQPTRRRRGDDERAPPKPGQPLNSPTHQPWTPRPSPTTAGRN